MTDLTLKRLSDITIKYQNLEMYLNFLINSAEGLDGSRLALFALAATPLQSHSQGFLECYMES